MINSDTSSTTPLISFIGNTTNCGLYLTNNYIDNVGNGNVIYTQNIISEAIAQNVFISDSSSRIPNAIFFIGKTQGFTTPFSIGQCAFIYSNSIGKTNYSPQNGACCGILISAPQNSNLVVSIFNNFFSLLGVPTSGYAVNNTGLTNESLVFYGNNISTNSVINASAYAIIGTINVSKFAYTNVA